jgi:hypothetical protein
VMLFALVAASGAVTTTSAETAFTGAQFTVKGNSLRPCDVLRIRLQGIAPATNSTDTLTIKLYLGATVIIATAAVDVNNNDEFFIDVEIVIRTNGAGGTFVAAGTQALGTPGTATMKPFLLGSTAIDTTADQLIKATATWSTNNAGNSCRVDILDVELLRK